MISGHPVTLGTPNDQRFPVSPSIAWAQAHSVPSLAPGRSLQVMVAVTGLFFQYSAVTSVVPVPLFTKYSSFAVGYAVSCWREYLVVW